MSDDGPQDEGDQFSIQLSPLPSTDSALPPLTSSVDISSDLTITPMALSDVPAPTLADALGSLAMPAVADTIGMSTGGSSSLASFAYVTGSAGTTAMSTGWTSSTYSALGDVSSTSSQTYNTADGQPGVYDSQTGQIYSYDAAMQMNAEGTNVSDG
ncbi:hypothetical protein, partial [Dyella jejuensis]